MRVEASGAVGGGSREAEPSIANLEDVYLDGTLVLISGGQAQRDPSDPTDLHVATVGPGEKIRKHGPTGPAWKAEDLYTSPLFHAKREFAATVSQWAQEASGWAVLSAEHGVVEPWRTVRPDETSIADLGGDETNSSHRVENRFRRRRPDGREIVTGLDRWAAKVAFGLMRWIASHREGGKHPGQGQAKTLLIIAEEEYINPLRERGVFEYGISRMVGNPNEGFKCPLTPTYLFESIDAETGEGRMAWLSDAISRFDKSVDPGDQVEMGRWSGEKRRCEQCGEVGPGSNLKDIGGEITCPSCRPSQCARCGEMTHETGMGNYPLCSECQTKGGGQKREPFNPDTAEQSKLTRTQ